MYGYHRPGAGALTALEAGAISSQLAELRAQLAATLAAAPTLAARATKETAAALNARIAEAVKAARDADEKNRALMSVECFDGAANEWRRVRDMSTVRSSGAVAVLPPVL